MCVCEHTCVSVCKCLCVCACASVSMYVDVSLMSIATESRLSAVKITYSHELYFVYVCALYVRVCAYVSMGPSAHAHLSDCVPIALFSELSKCLHVIGGSHLKRKKRTLTTPEKKRTSSLSDEPPEITGSSTPQQLTE